MSDAGINLVFWMVRELSSCSHASRGIIEGCFDMGINNYKLTLPEEPKDVIVERVVEVLNNLF